MNKTLREETVKQKGERHHKGKNRKRSQTEKK